MKRHDGTPGISRSLLEDAWRRVRTRGEAAGVDGIELPVFEKDLDAAMSALATDMATGVYTPQAYRAVDIPRADGRYRRIVVATVRDRVAQTAAALVLQPRIEPLFHPASFAYRQGMGVQDALVKVCGYRDRGLKSVLCADVEQFFDSVDHGRLWGMLGAAKIESPWLDWLKAWLTALVVDRDRAAANSAGLPQGLPISPILANLYLTPFDRTMVEAGWKLVRYADDLVVCCTDRSACDRAKIEANAALASLGLRLSANKTNIETFDGGFKFLGARFVGTTVLPATAHPYECDYTPPPPKRPQRPPTQGLPHTLLRTLYIQEQGSHLGCHGKRFVVERSGKTLIDLPAHHIDQIFVFGRVQISSAAMAFCLMRNLPVYLFSSHGRYYGTLSNMEDSSHGLIRAQFALAEDPRRRMDFARNIVAAKVRNGIELLAQHARNHSETQLDDVLTELKRSLKRVPHIKKIEPLRGIEGAAAAAYFRGYARCFRGELAFLQRVRRPPTDPVNSLLSLGYTLLFYNIHSYMCARGLLPTIGLFHEPGRGHPALASDLIEEFRAPVVDALVLAVINRGELVAADFYYGEGTPQPCLLKDESRPIFLRAFEAKLAGLLHHPDIEHEVDWRRILDLQVSRFRRYVEGKVESYIPFGNGK